MSAEIRVLLADDHEIVRQGLRAILMEAAEITLIGEAANGTEAVALAASLHPDIVLMDIVMPDMDGIEATRRLRQACPESRVLILTSFADDAMVRAAIQVGAIGYLLKDVLKAELFSAIRAAAQDQPTLHPEAQRHLMRQLTTPQAPSPFQALTGRERDILCLIARGHNNKEIAAALYLSEGTVKGYVSSILRKLEVEDRTQAALLAVKHRLDCGDAAAR